ncbi:MAG TPA: S8 family peptidase [Acidobacteriota bacterium]|nr:S8 family peptidase [Acidobacteriota bacterium]
MNDRAIINERHPTLRLWSCEVILATVILLATLLAAPTVSAAAPAAAPTAPAYDYSRIIVKLVAAPDAPAKIVAGRSGRADFDRLVANRRIEEIKRIFPTQRSGHPYESIAASLRMSDYLIVKVPQNVDPDALLDELKRSSDVEWAAFDAIVRIAGGTVAPDDFYFATHQYALDNTGTQPPYDPGTAGADLEMKAAWAFTTGDTSVILAILDTGMDKNHPEFAGRLWINENEPIDDVDNDLNGLIDDRFGWDFVNEDNSPGDDHGHGTHVTGIAAATGMNGIGIAGMNWKCRIMPLKVVGSDGSGTVSEMWAGIYYAVNQGADVISLSLGVYADLDSSRLVTEYTAAAGVTVVAAMGNDNFGDTPLFPAGYESVIGVGATDSDDQRAVPLGSYPGSNFGDWIDVCAPGSNIWSTYLTGFGSYVNMSGTSMATPHVSGLASLILSLRPDYPPDSVQRLIRLGVEDLVGRPEEDTPGFDIYHGWGRINARITLQALALDLEPILTVPGPQGVTEGDTITFAISAFDSNFTFPVLSLETFPNAELTDYGDGTAEFTFAPDYTQAGIHEIVFVASDGQLADTESVAIDVVQGCLCLCQGDPQCDSVTNVLDVVWAVEVAFRGGSSLIDDACYPHPGGRTDVNCDGYTDVLDVVTIVGVAFRGQPANYCAPCAP